MGTSQPHVARIEAGEDNLTADTVERYITALNGRLYISIAPAEMDLPRLAPWWENAVSTVSHWNWNLHAAAFKSDGCTQDVLLWLQRTLSSDVPYWKEPRSSRSELKNG
jgi:hypothetical protein